MDVLRSIESISKGASPCKRGNHSTVVVGSAGEGAKGPDSVTKKGMNLL
jgi:hypothetical protein